MPTALHHVTVFSRGSQNVIRLLHDVLGLPIAAELIMDAKGLGPLADWCHDSSTIRTVVLGGGSIGLVELIDLGDSSQGEDEVQDSSPRTGVNQLCFAVRDVEDVLDACRSLGLVLRVKGRQNIEIQGQQFSVAVLMVDGLRVQLSQLCASAHSRLFDRE
jgi:catechol 2,3-dioxygenase-like lactoylglutathione lyase family enzyme